MAHDFEVYLRDKAMFDPESIENSPQTIDLNEDVESKSTKKELWAGFPKESSNFPNTFTFNPKFDLRGECEPYKGFATSEGTKAYASRSDIVYKSSFKEVKMAD